MWINQSSLLHDCAFLTSCWLKSLIYIYGIKCIELQGKIPVKNWCFALNTFCKSTCHNSPHVLILSIVNMVGLNLAYTNIMIMVVSGILRFSLTLCISALFDLLSEFHLVGTWWQIITWLSLSFSAPKICLYLSNDDVSHSRHIPQ